jgi:hypothetical protein
LGFWMHGMMCVVSGVFTWGAHLDLYTLRTRLVFLIPKHAVGVWAARVSISFEITSFNTVILEQHTFFESWRPK